MSDPNAVFVPGQYVPLSEFVVAPASQTTLLHVDPEILNFVSTPIRVALQDPNKDPDGGTYTVVSPGPFGVDLLSGTVAITPNRDRRAVVVTASIVNDLPIVSHWEDSRNESRGGQCRDAIDGTKTLTWSPSGGFGAQPGGGGGAWLDPQLGKWIRYPTDQYALFSDGTETTPQSDGEIADQIVPSYERYIGENWASKVSDLAAIRLSDMCREWTGRPIAHRNPTPAFALDPAPLCSDPPSLPVAPPTLDQGLPYFQVVHAYIVEYDVVDWPGNEDCLATFIVPPYWFAPGETPDPTYPVLFASGYDVSATLFNDEPSAGFFKPIGELADEQEPVVGILINGGGATASLTQQLSVFGNTQKLFDEALELLATDRDRVVAWGGSRGATAALALSGNPFNDAFTAQYVFAGNPTTYAGNGLALHVNPTYALIQESVDAHSGYIDSWQPSFDAPSQLDGVLRTGPQLMAETIYGTHEFVEPNNVIDDERSPGSPPFVQGLVGARVVLAAATHDYAKPFSHMTEYQEALLAAGVETRFEIYYRSGHGGLVVDTFDVVDAFHNVLSGIHASFVSGVFHFHPLDEQAELDAIGTQFFPAHAPLVLEAPVWVALGQDHTYTIAGPPGTQYAVVAAPIDYEAFRAPPHIPLVYTGPAATIVAGTLPQAAPGVAMTSHTEVTSVPLDLSLVGGWAYGVGYIVPGGPFVATDEETSTPPSPLGSAAANAAPVVYFGWYWDPNTDLNGDQIPDPPPPNFYTLATQSIPVHTLGLTAHTRTGGISTDVDF